MGVVKAIAKEREGVLMKGGEDALFDAEMNAKVSEANGREMHRRRVDSFFLWAQSSQVVRDAENYYRQMFREDVSSWNLRGWDLFGYRAHRRGIVASDTFSSRSQQTRTLRPPSPPSAPTSPQLPLHPQN